MKQTVRWHHVLFPVLCALLVVGLFESTAQENWQDRFPHKYTAQNVTVCSDISHDFSAIHGAHARKAWNYFSKLFRRTPGTRIELYYTNSAGLYGEILKRYPAIVIKGARQLTALWAGDHRKWFIMPYVTPDFGTQLHEMSHDFFYFTYPKLEDSPWLKEGSGMYFESGKFDDKGDFIVPGPMLSFHSLFKERHAKNQLIPLKELLFMTGKQFYAADFTRTYPQSMMFFFYVMEREESMMTRFFEKLNNGEFSGNRGIVDFMTAGAKKTIEEMEKGYVDYSLQ